MKQSHLKSLCILSVILFLSACGGGGGGGSNDTSSGGTELLTGTFVDSPVQGLRWVSGDMEGTTDSAGTFQYEKGGTVKFYTGSILIGEATGNSLIIPLDIVNGAQNISDPAVTNVIRFLMTLDNDNNPSNGIVITEAVANLALGKDVNFAQSTAGFAESSELQALIAELTSVTDAGTHSLTSVSEAITHAENSIGAILAGNYSGAYSGDNTGTWSGTVTASGTISGTATSSFGETVTFIGTVSRNENGTTQFETSGGASDGTIFTGIFNRDGTASGIWNWFNQETGIWSGSKG